MMHLFALLMKVKQERTATQLLSGMNLARVRLLKYSKFDLYKEDCL